MDHLLTGTPTLSRLKSGLFGPHLAILDEIAQSRLDQGYAQETVRDSIRTLADFGEWLKGEATSIDKVTAQMLDAFLRTGPARHSRAGRARGAREFLSRLQNAGVCAAPILPEGPSAPLVTEFGKYLEEHRGLCPASIRNYSLFATRFLAERFEQEPVQPLELEAKDVTGFVVRHAKNWGAKRNSQMVTALRSFFRYLRTQGLTDMDLSGAVPTVAAWRLQEVPKGMEVDEIEAVLSHCDRTTVVGLRDFAILLLLARLGLRAGELVRLCLEDIDWGTGEIVIHSKGRCLHRLPLPKDAGHAVAEYLTTRPTLTETRRVFVRTRAPYWGFHSSEAISSIVRRALSRAGLTPKRRGAHLFRHALATRMLSHGATLTEIGQLLRHQRVDTTAIYAKVALQSLRTLAMPWPGGAV